MPTALKEKSPKYARLVSSLTRDIEKGVLRPGDRLPTFGEMRERYGAAINTVDRAFLTLEQNGLIRREPGRGVFVADPQRREMTGFIGFAGTAFSSRNLPLRGLYSAHLAEGVQQIIEREERRIVLLNTHSNQGWDGVDGVLVSVSDGADEVVRKVPRGVPCVTMLSAAEGVPGVVADDYGGARKATEYLLSLGHKKIACLMQTSFLLPRLRASGYRDALVAAGIEPNAEWIRIPPVTNDAAKMWELGYEIMREWLKNGWKKLGCTALLCQNDQFAIGAIKALSEAGLRVPDNISVVGFDGTELAAYSSPTLTTVEVPLTEIGTIATETLFCLIKGETSRALTTVVPTELRIGESTAARRK